MSDMQVLLRISETHLMKTGEEFLSRLQYLDVPYNIAQKKEACCVWDEEQPAELRKYEM